MVQFKVYCNSNVKILVKEYSFLVLREEGGGRGREKEGVISGKECSLNYLSPFIYSMRKCLVGLAD